MCVSKTAMIRGRPNEAGGLITFPVLSQFGPGVKSRLPTSSGPILNMFPGPELL